MANLDKFYTIPSYSKKCIDTVFNKYNTEDFYLVIEPSAGDGSFFHQIVHPNKIAIDIAPEHPDICQLDFLKYCPAKPKGKILTIGNPPFGRISSLAIKFFNHAAPWSSVIAFIVPRTFRKTSVQNKLSPYFHLVYDEDVPTSPCQFTPKMGVKCCFQIWERREVERHIVDLPTKHPDWDFLPFGALDETGQPTPPEGADFVIRAYGGKIGEIKKDDLGDLRPKSWHWIKSNIDPDILSKRFETLDYSNSLNTARQNSMGKSELVQLYSEAFDLVV